ncbi:MAG: lamin tail domain-containing protein [Christensenellaceae bacterium]
MKRQRCRSVLATRRSRRARGRREAAEDTPTLVITEIAQRGSYEFFELYNNSDAAVDLSDYTIRYISGMYSDYANATVSVTYAEKTVGSMPADGAMLGAGETAVFWCNGDGAAIIAEEEKAFNDNYGLSGDSALTAGVNLFSFGTSMPDTNGKSGKNSRGFSVAAKESGEIVTQAFFSLNRTEHSWKRTVPSLLIRPNPSCTVRRPLPARRSRATAGAIPSSRLSATTITMRIPVRSRAFRPLPPRKRPPNRKSLRRAKTANSSMPLPRIRSM